MRTCATIVCIFASILLALGRPDGNSGTINMAHVECQANSTTYVDEDILHETTGGKSSDNTSVKAHILCVTTKLGLLNDDGKVDRSKLRMVLSSAVLDEGLLEEAMEDCVAMEDTIEEAAVALDKCLRGYLGHLHYH